jgi:hypothetical protein
MRILLQQLQTKRYFCRPELWSSRAEAAFDFGHSQKALEYIRKHQLNDVQLVVRFDDPRWDEVFPMPVLIATLNSSKQPGLEV